MHLCWCLLFIKLQAFLLTPTQVFSCEYCEIFKNTYLEEHLRSAASTGPCLMKAWLDTKWLLMSIKNIIV